MAPEQRAHHLGLLLAEAAAPGATPRRFLEATQQLLRGHWGCVATQHPQQHAAVVARLRALVAAAATAPQPLAHAVCRGASGPRMNRRKLCS